MTSESQIFHPTKKYWINTALSFLFLVILLLIMGYGVWYFSDRFPSCFFVLAPIILFASCIWGLLALWQRLHTSLEFSESELTGHTGWKPFSYLWNEIIFITEYEGTENKGKTPYLVIATQDRAKEFNLTGFDKTAVWQAIETYAPPEILEPDAYKKLDQYQLLEQETNKTLNAMPLPVSVTISIGWRVFFIIVFLFFSFCAYGSFTSDTTPIVTFFFLFMALMGLYGIFSGSGILTADTEKLALKKLWGTYQIDWSEIKFLEISSQTGWLVFHGDDKRLGFAAPGLWGGKRKNDFHLFMSKQIEERQLEVKTSWKAPYHISKNVRIS